MSGKRTRSEGSQVPVTVLTGFLGSGKTTLLNHILKSPDHGMKFAIIENEFGEIGVDEKVIVGQESTDEEVIEVMNGCICCTVRGDLVQALKRLHKKVSKFDAVLIETTGLADPAPVAQTFFVDEEIQKLYYLDGICTVCDAKHIITRLDDEKPEGVENEAVEQVAFADRILLNKVDLVEGATPDEREENLKKIESRIKGINSSAKIVRCALGAEVPSELPLKDGDGDTEMAVSEVKEDAQNKRMVFSEEKLAELKALKEAGTLIGCDQIWKEIIDLKAFDLDRVLKMDPEFLDTEGEHEHDDSVSSCSTKFEGELNINKLENLMGMLMQGKAQDLFRYKGVMAVKGMEQKWVFQGVHMLFSSGFSDNKWKSDEPRECRFVFIGRNLDKAALIKQIESCKAEETLRFKVGDTVEANVGKWTKGKILKTWDQGNPYRIELEDKRKTNVYGPMDNDRFVRAVAGA